MQLTANELFNDNGKVAQQWAHFIVGERVIKQPSHGLRFTRQSTYIQRALTIKQGLKAGVYITLSHTRDTTGTNSIKSIQVTPVYLDTVVNWSAEGEQAFHWSQIFIEWDLLNQVTGELPHKAEHFFERVTSFHTDTGDSLELLPTTAIRSDFTAVLSQESKGLALAGKLYGLIFQIIEHIQINHHLAHCEGCQHKLFKSQNLLESRPKLTSKELARLCGLTQTAIEIGYPLIIGMTLEEYQIEVAIRKALTEAHEHTPKELSHKIEIQTGLDANEIEEACLKRFGVMSHQLSGIH